VTTTVEDSLSELAQAPPKAFTQARNALVAKATKLGQPEVAARLKAIRRPTAAVWVVNQLAHKERDSVGRLIAAADRMREAQLGRGASAGNLTKAIADHRAALAHLAQRAEAILEGANLGAPHQTLMRVETTLAGAAADPDFQVPLRQGRLEHEATARGFDVFAGEKVAPSTPAATTRRPPTAASPRPTSASRVAPVEKEERGRGEARLAKLREDVSRAEARANQQRAKSEEARKRVAELTGMLNDARRRATELAQEETRAMSALRAAHQRLQSAGPHDAR